MHTTLKICALTKQKSQQIAGFLNGVNNSNYKNNSRASSGVATTRPASRATFAIASINCPLLVALSPFRNQLLYLGKLVTFEPLFLRKVHVQ
jgi:hypothetical protein